jgi:hypothetical protein
MSSWIRCLAFATSLLFSSQKKARQRAERVQSSLDNSYQAAALTCGLIEFQKVQVYFCIFFQGVVIEALLSGGKIFEAESLQELQMTINLLGDVSAISMICLTFGLYILHADNKRS